MRFRRMLQGGIALGALSFSLAVSASETITYSYDELGRLTAVKHAGTVNANQAHSLCYDPAGNRMVYKSSSTGAAATCPTGTPTPTPTPGSSPPVAVNDSTSMTVCSNKIVNVTYNDTDADGHLPLTVTAVTSNTRVQASVYGTNSVQLQSAMMTGGTSVTYTIKDTSGATDTGTLSVSITSGGPCASPFEPLPGDDPPPEEPPPGWDPDAPAPEDPVPEDPVPEDPPPEDPPEPLGEPAA